MTKVLLNITWTIVLYKIKNKSHKSWLKWMLLYYCKKRLNLNIICFITLNVKTVFNCRMHNFYFICEQVKLFCLLQFALNNLFSQTFMHFSILQLNHILVLVYKLLYGDCVWFSKFSHASIKLISWTTCKIKYMKSSLIHFI